MSLVLVGGEVVTLDPHRPRANAVVVSGDRITFVGDIREARDRAGAKTEVIDAQGSTIVPGLIDSHFHLLATAAQRSGVDCSAANAPSIPGLLARLRATRAARRPGAWIRAFGYDHELLAEHRHPTRRELDTVTMSQPVRLDHKTGHAVVLNSSACIQLGLPAGDHDGVFFESPRTDGVAFEELRDACAELSDALLRYGITRICDAGAANGPSEVELLRRWRSEGVIKQETSVLVGEDHAGLASGLPDEGVPVAGVKVVLEEHDLDQARLDALAELFRTRSDATWIAIHVLELGALAILLDHLEMLQGGGVPIGRCRIEHLGLCPPAWIPRLRSLGVHVVTQPIFLADRQETYLRTVPPEQHNWLYPAARLIQASVPVAASSDSPVGDPNPYRGMVTATDRGAHRRMALGQPIPLSREQTLGLYTVGAASALGRSADIGRIAPGYRADLAVLDGSLMDASESSLPELRARLVAVGGEITHIA